MIILGSGLTDGLVEGVHFMKGGIKIQAMVIMIQLTQVVFLKDQ